MCVCVCVCVCVRPDGAAGVAEDRRSKTLSHADEAGSINLHDQIVYLDPAHTDNILHVWKQTETKHTTHPQLLPLFLLPYCTIVSMFFFFDTFTDKSEIGWAVQCPNTNLKLVVTETFWGKHAALLSACSAELATAIIPCMNYLQAYDLPHQTRWFFAFVISCKAELIMQMKGEDLIHMDLGNLKLLSWRWASWLLLSAFFPKFVVGAAEDGIR